VKKIYAFRAWLKKKNSAVKYLLGWGTKSNEVPLTCPRAGDSIITNPKSLLANRQHKNPFCVETAR